MSICQQESDYLSVGPSSNVTAGLVKTMRLVNTLLLISFPSALMLVGTMGNLVNLAVLYRQAFSKKITCTAITLRFLAYVDIAVLWTSLSRLLVMGVYDYDYRTFSFNFCRFHKFWHFFCMSTTNWTIALLAFTRYIRMVHPFRVHILFSECRIYTALVVIIILAGSSSLIYFRNYISSRPSHTNCDICVLMPSANTVVFKMVQLLPVYFIPGCLLLFFHWRIIINYQLMQTRRDKLRAQFQEIVKKMVELREKIDGVDAPNQQAGAGGGGKNYRSSTSDYMKPNPRLTPVESESLASAIRDVKKGAGGEHVMKKIRFSHVVDLETARVDTLSCCSRPSQMSCSSVDPSLETNKDEIKKIMLIKEERNLRRIRAAYGILWLAAQSDDYVMWDTFSGNVRRQRRRDMLDAFGPKGQQGCCRLRSPTMHVLVAMASTAFLIFNTPFCAWYIVSHMFPGDTPMDSARRNLAGNSALLLSYLSSTLNFVFYSTLSSKFQLELCKCLTCYRNRKSVSEHSDTLTSPRESQDETGVKNAT